MPKKNRTAQIQGTMALVASATAELQRLTPHRLRAADAVAKVTTHNDSPDLTRARKLLSGRSLTSGLKCRCEKSKFMLAAVKAASTIRRLRRT